MNVTNVISLNEFVEQGGEPVMDAKNNSHFIQPEESVQEEELNSSILEVSESRVSQLHTKALLKMRKRMGNYMGILID